MRRPSAETARSVQDEHDDSDSDVPRYVPRVGFDYASAMGTRGSSSGFKAGASNSSRSAVSRTTPTGHAAVCEACGSSSWVIKWNKGQRDTKYHRCKECGFEW
eukprot:2721713-Prymnesium_polylepis.1